MGRTAKREVDGALIRDIQRVAPFGALRPRRRYMVEPGAIHPVIRIAHRRGGGLRTATRIILDHEFVLILRGRGTVTLGKQVMGFKPHDLFLVKPFEPNQFLGADSSCEHLAVHFDLTPSVPLRAKLERREPYDVVLPRGAEIPQVTALPAGGPVESTFLELLRTRENGGAAGDLHASALLATIIARLIQRRGGAAGGRNRAKLERAVAVIEKEYPRALTVQDLAAVAGLSPPHFNRLFRQWTGQTPMDYLRRRRIAAARELLADVDLTIKEVARRVGFDDPYHFSRVFRKVDGLSPSEFREDLG